MKMVSRIAFDNMKYHKSKNILTAIAVFLTTVLLFVIPTIGKDMIDAQYAMVNEYYPQWHALYRGVSQDTVDKLSSHNDIGTYGLRSDVGYVMVENDKFSDLSAVMMYMDENGIKLYKQELESGRLPQKKNEIVISRALLDVLHLEGEIGDSIILQYQIIRDGGLDYKEESEFIISGFIEEVLDEDSSLATSTLYVSEEFLKSELTEDEIRYRFLFQVADIENATTDDVEYVINNIADRFSISEEAIEINTSYLGANYVDPAILQCIIIIMIIIVIAGIITIYSIYYVSMTQRVQEFGRLKAIGASKGQIKQIVIREGIFVALCAIPLGLLAGTIITKAVLFLFVELLDSDVDMAVLTRDIIIGHKINLYHGWIYVMASAIAMLTVYLSLLKPMKIAGRVSAIEAMRYQGNRGSAVLKRRNSINVSVGRLARNNILGNKKKSIITIVSLSITGIFIMVVASVLSCTSPELITNEDFNGQYMMMPTIEENNKEYPELAWSEIQKNNPLGQELKQQIEALDGVKRVDVFSYVDISCMQDSGNMEAGICGIPEEYASEIEDGIIEGEATYEDLKSGDKIVIDKTLLHWYPGLAVGDKLVATIHDSGREYEKELEIIAIGDYRGGLLNYNSIVMAKEAADKLVTHNANKYFCVIADKDYDEDLYNALSDISDSNGRLELSSRESMYNIYKGQMMIINYGCYIFLGVLSAICIMNLINTMINSVHIRKKELAMMQSIGMSDHQLQKMLLTEGMFYTVGTLAVTLALGSVLGYMAFLWAKSEGVLRIRTFSYPWEAALIIVAVLALVQIFLAVTLSRSVKRESLIERIRFNE